ncbi:MAG: hypothetical protein R2867_08580 [Caldilineaceae bacterium]
MFGTFNVAIGAFAVLGEGEGRDAADRIAQDFANAIEQILASGSDAARLNSAHL